MEEKQLARQKMFDSIKPADGNKKMFAALSYIAIVIVAYALGQIAGSKNGTTVFFVIVVGGAYLTEWVKDKYVKYHFFAAVFVYAVANFIILVLSLLVVGSVFVIKSAPLTIESFLLLLGGIATIYLLIMAALAIAAFLGYKLRIPFLTNVILDRMIAQEAKETKEKKEAASKLLAQQKK
jgi:hypothetical protein